MVVEKRGELKNKMVVGGLLLKPMNFRDSLYSDLTGRNWEIVYYVLDLSTGEVSSLPATLVDYNCMPSMAAVGSGLYIFGGGKSVSPCDDSTNPTNKTGKRKNQQQQQQQQGSFSSHMLDLTNPKNGWSVAAAAGVNSSRPMGVIEFGGKLYVFNNSESGFFCEVFDPQHKKWRRLKSPPFPPPPSSGAGGDGIWNKFYRNVTLPVMADYKRNRIIMYFEVISAMYAYYPCEDQWRCVVEDLNGGWRSLGEPVALGDDGVIYIHNRRMKAFFRAYDTVSKQWLDVRLSPEAEAKGDCKSYLYYSSYRTLLHRGNGVMCLLTPVFDLLGENPTSLHLVQFNVRLNQDSKEVLVTPLSSQYFLLHTHCNPGLYLPL